ARMVTARRAWWAAVWNSSRRRAVWLLLTVTCAIGLNSWFRGVMLKGGGCSRWGPQCSQRKCWYESSTCVARVVDQPQYTPPTPRHSTRGLLALESTLNRPGVRALIASRTMAACLSQSVWVFRVPVVAI